MKKLLLLMLGVVLSLPAMARDFYFEYEGQSLLYTVLDEETKTCQLHAGVYYSERNSIRPGNAPKPGELVIPEKAIDEGVEYTVIDIPEYAFSFADITSISLPETITSIGIYAFYSCTGLTSVSIPESVTSIGEFAFMWCIDLASAKIGNSVTSIGKSTFCYCISLTSVTIPESVTSIGDYAFWNCYTLPSVTIPNSVTSIGDYAFGACTGLTSITIPISVTSIGECAFWDCFGLTSVYYGADVPIIGNINIFSNKTFEEAPEIIENQTYEQATLYVSEKGFSLAGTIDPWKNFKNIQIYDFLGAEAVAADFDDKAPCEVFDLNGLKAGNSLDNLAPGLYIVRQGKTVKKVVVGF